MKEVYSRAYFYKFKKISEGTEGVVYKNGGKAIKVFNTNGITDRIYLDSDISDAEKIEKYLESKKQKLSMLKERYNKKYDIPIYDTYKCSDAIIAYEMKRMKRDRISGLSRSNLSQMNDLFNLVRDGIADLNHRGMYNYDLRIRNLYYKRGKLHFYDQDNYRIDDIKEDLRVKTIGDYMTIHPDATPKQQQLVALVMFYLHLVMFDEIHYYSVKTINSMLSGYKNIPVIKEMLCAFDGQEIDLDAIMINNEEDYSYIRI